MLRSGVFYKPLIGMVFAWCLVFSTVSPVLAVSISPPTVEAPTVLRGVSQTKSIRVGRNPNEKGDLQIMVSTRGDYASYIIFEPTLTIPNGVDGVEYEFQIDATNVAVGTYTVPMTFSIMPPAASGEESGNFVGIIAGATAMIEFTVSGEQVVGYELLSATVADVESDDHPFVTFAIRNTGNVDWKPEQIDLIFTDENDPTHTIAATITGEQLAFISPGQMSEQQVEVQQTLPEGDYKATASVVDNSQVVGQLSTQTFSVLAPGSLLTSGELISATTKKDRYTFGEKILLEGVFKNTGDVPVSGILFSEVSQDGTYIDLIRGEEVIAGVGEETVFSQVIEPQEKGVYLLTSYVKFSSKKSNSLDTSVTVGSGGQALSFLNSAVGLGVLVAIVLLVVALVLKHRKKSKSKKKTKV